MNHFTHQKTRAAIIGILIVVVVFGFPSSASSQSVGVVLSGGGAAALAHVGFLRAMEENEIPIDCIGGTSMGAVIAAMYASGYTPAEIDSTVRSKEFEQMATGLVDDQFRFYFKEYNADAGMATFKYSGGQLVTNAIPTNLIDPVLLDWKFMEAFSQPSAAAGNNFDSLFIPFRCIAADVAGKQEIVFRSGPLSVAARASSTYPFYLPPRRIDGVLLYDGGIYNNFPANVIYHEFLPDVIIGCNVSENSKPSSEDDIFSQLETMILIRTEFSKVCDQMVIVTPDVGDIGTFDFAMLKPAISKGYKAALDSMPVIRTMVERRVDAAERSAKRSSFRKKFKPFLVSDVVIEGLEDQQSSYVRRMMGRKNNLVPIAKLKAPYFRIFMDDKIGSIFPVATKNRNDEYFTLNLDVKPEKDLLLVFGGNFSSRAINTGYIGVRYNIFGRTSATISANSYFGRFYGSVNSNLRWDVSGMLPFSIQAGFTLNRWDYYKSVSTFFEDVKPSFIVLNERFGGLTFRFPAGNKGMIKADAHYAFFYDEYYQSPTFLSTDTADRTDFESGIFRITWERTTLNRKQYPNAGTHLAFSVKAVTGVEVTRPGSTSFFRDTTHTRHEWIATRFEYENYFLHLKPFTLGFSFKAVYSTQSFFKNYISSVIAAPAFMPIPESSTYFLSNFRAHTWTAGGMAVIWNFNKNLELRGEIHGFVTPQPLLSNNLSQAYYGVEINPMLISSGAVVFHSPIGPMSFSANYYDRKDEPWSFLFNFGYIIFNSSAKE
ncbi:MAG: patatin-like phospholipase family protein [Flavobacteriales bacterium]|nr:patatin-like phospholipase family protein [Flavobacteriales bacterium]